MTTTRDSTLVSARVAGFMYLAMIGIGLFGEAFMRGCLIFKSGYVPRALGWLLGLAGVSYLVNSFALLLSPSLAYMLLPAVLLPAFAGELALTL
jgi:hypothetical protein